MTNTAVVTDAGNFADTLHIAKLRAERDETDVRIVRDGRLILTVPSNWRDNAERWI